MEGNSGEGVDLRKGKVKNRTLPIQRVRHPWAGQAPSLQNFKAEFFDYWIGQDFAGDFFYLGAGFVLIGAVEFEDEEFSLADAADLRIAKRRERVLNCFALRIEDGGFEHYPDMSFHGWRL
jgi:hypothetical protein